MLELDPSLTDPIGARLDREMLLGDGADFGWANDLSADVMEVLGESEIGGGQFVRDDGLVLSLTLDGQGLSAG
jgi:hypothetical protein